MDPHIGGNAVPEITREEHDHSLSAKRVTVVGGSISGSSTVYIGTPTLYAVVNTGAAGDSTAKIGFATVNVAGSATIYAVVNTGAAGQASVVLDNSVNNIGFATVAISNPTLYAVVNTGGSSSNVTLNPSNNFIGLATVVIGNSISQPVTVQPPDSGTLPVSFGNVTLNSSINSVGFVTVNGSVIIKDPTGAEMDLFKENDNFAIGGDHGLMILSVTDTTPRKYKPLASNVTALDAESNAKDRLVVEGYNSIYNGSSWDRIRDTTSSNATTGIGLQGAGILGFDGTNYRRVSVDGNGILKSNTTLLNMPALTSGVANIGFATVAVSTPTLYAVVNTAAAGQASVVLSNSVSTIGFATVNVAAIAAGGNYIGLASVNGSVVNLAGTANIGCVTLLNMPALTASAAFIGIVTVASTVQLRAGAAYAGLMTVNLGAGAAYIGLASVNVGGSLPAGVNGIGFVTVAGSVNANNAGTTKTLITHPINLSTGSVATIAVPTNNAAIKLTNAVLGSNATTQFRMKSGVTYLTGNASLGITLFPGGGFTQVGSPDSPSWIGLPSGALVIEKFDTGGIISQLSGHIVYFSE